MNGSTSFATTGLLGLFYHSSNYDISGATKNINLQPPDDNNITQDEEGEELVEHDQREADKEDGIVASTKKPHPCKKRQVIIGNENQQLSDDHFKSMLADITESTSISSKARESSSSMPNSKAKESSKSTATTKPTWLQSKHASPMAHR